METKVFNSNLKEGDYVIYASKKRGGKVIQLTDTEVTIRPVTGDKLVLPRGSVKEPKVSGFTVVEFSGNGLCLGKHVRKKGNFFGKSLDPNTGIEYYVFEKENGGFHFSESGGSKKQKSVRRR